MDANGARPFCTRIVEMDLTDIFTSISIIHKHSFMLTNRSCAIRIHRLLITPPKKYTVTEKINDEKHFYKETEEIMQLARIRIMFLFHFVIEPYYLAIRFDYDFKTLRK